MDFAGKTSIIFMVCIILNGAVADFEVNLLHSIGLNDYSPILLKDVTAATRPNSISRAYAFGHKTAAQVINAGTYDRPLEKIITGFNDRTYNQDITLLVTFKLNSHSRRKRNTLLSFISKSTGRKYLSIYLRPQESSDMVVEGHNMGSSSKGYNIYLDINYYNGDEFLQDSVNLKDKAIIGKWTTLTARIQKGTNLQIHVNCELVADKKLPATIPSIPSDSELRIAQTTKRDFWTKTKRIVRRFQGVIYKEQLLFGKKAFLYLNPCGICGDSDKKISIEGQGTNHKCFDEQARLYLRVGDL